MDIAQLKQYSQYFGFGCLALYLGLLIWDAFLDGDEDDNLLAAWEIKIFITI
jgi:hypothetical protein